MMYAGGGYLGEYFPPFGGQPDPRVINVIGNYVTEIEVVGTYSTEVRAIGTYVTEIEVVGSVE